MDSTEAKERDVAEYCRVLLQSEYESMHRRMTWLATLQGFLFAGVGIVWKSADSRFLVGVLGVLGMIVALLVYVSFVGPNVTVG